MLPNTSTKEEEKIGEVVLSLPVFVGIYSVSGVARA